MTIDAELISALLARKTQAAVVCTEPGAIALAAAAATELLGESPASIEVTASPGVFKNALGVGLPGTERTGPAVAAALGAAVGRSEARLEILRGVAPDRVAAAHRLLDGGEVTARADLSKGGVYILVRVSAGGRTAEVMIEGGHSRIVRATLDGQEIALDRSAREGPERTEGEQGPEEPELAALSRWPFGRLVRAALAVPRKDAAYVLEGALSNLRLAETVLSGDCQAVTPLGTPPLMGLSALSLDRNGGPPPLEREVRAKVGAAVAARMAGVDWPVMTSAGSGNQGITVSVPLILAARAVGADVTQQTRALVLAHATCLYVHAFIGEISPVCGAVAAAAGVAAGVCLLLGGSTEELEAAAQMIIANLLGTLCDGAKASCALKCSTAAVEGLLCGQWAKEGIQVQGRTGITGGTLSETLELAASLIQSGLARTDEVIIGSR